MYRAPTLRQPACALKHRHAGGPKMNGAPLKQGSMYSLIVFKSPDRPGNAPPLCCRWAAWPTTPRPRCGKIHLGLPITNRRRLIRPISSTWAGQAEKALRT